MNLRTITIYFFGSVGTALISFALVPLIAWFYSPEDVGKLAVLTVFSSFTTLLFSFGLDQAFVREYHEDSNKKKLFSMVLLPTSFLFLTVIFLLFLIDINLVSKIIFEESVIWVGIFAVFFAFFSFVLRFLSLILRMEERAMEFSISQILPKIIVLVLVLGLVTFIEEKNFTQLIMVNVISVFLTLIYMLYVTRYFLIGCYFKNFEIGKFKPLLSYGLPLVIGGLASWGLSFFDRVFLKFYSDFSQLGVYSVAISIASITAIFSSVFNTIWAPLVYKWISESTVDESKIKLISDNVLAAAYFFTILTCLFSWVANYILPKEYYLVASILPACLLSPLIYTITEISSVGISISKKTIYLMFSAFIAVFFNVVFNLLLVKDFGAAGAAVSTTLSFYVFYILRTELSKKLWIHFPTKKSYLAVSILTIITSVSAFWTGDRTLFLVLTVFSLLFGFLIFRSNLKFALNKTTDFIESKKSCN